MADNIFDGSTDSNWSVAANWSQNAVPTASDGHVTKFDATSPNCTVNTSSRVCQALDFTGYTNTITMSQQITVSGPITLGASMVISGSGALLATTTATHTSAGKAWPNAMSINGAAQTHTFADDWTISGLATLGLTTQTVTMNGSTITFAGGIRHSGNTCIITGTTVFNVTGGTLDAPTPVTTGRIANPIKLAGTVNVDGPFNVNLAQLLLVSGATTTDAGAWTTGGGAHSYAFSG